MLSDSAGLYVPSGTRVPLVGLPSIDRPIRLTDGRVLRFETIHSQPCSYIPGDIQHAQVWRGPERLMCLASLDRTEAWGPLLHVSMSYGGQKRRPSWEDLVAIKAAFYGDVDACMILPREEDYIHGVPGYGPTEVFHLWQIPQRWGIR